MIMCSYLLIECLFSISVGTMLSFLSGFDETDAMFLEFANNLNYPAEGSSSVDDHSSESNGTLSPNYLNFFSHQLVI